MLINNKGFTLLEVMVSLAIIAISLLGISSLTVGVIKGNAFSNNLTTATILAQGKLEELENLSFGDAQLTGDNWTVNNWDTNADYIIDNNDSDADGDSIPDFFDVDDSNNKNDGVIDNDAVFDHADANPIDIQIDNGDAVIVENVQLGGFYRVWNVWNNGPIQAVTTRKTVAVMVSWVDINGRIHTVTLSTEISI